MVRLSKSNKRRKTTKIRIEHFTTLLAITVILLAGYSGCAQKNKPQPSIDAPRQFSKTPDSEKSSDGSPIVDPILDVVLERIELPPDFNPYYGKSYWGLTENNQKPPGEYYVDPLFWIPGWAIRTEHYPNGDRESFLMLPSYDEKYSRYKEQWDAHKKEFGTLTRDDHYRILAEVYTEGLSNLHAAKYLGKIRNPYAIEFAQKAHEENPDDFHTLWVLAHLQMMDTYSRSSNPDALHNTRTFDSYRRLIAMNPNVARVQFEFGDVVPDRAEAINAYKKSFELDPTLYYGQVLRSLAIRHMVSAPKKAVGYLKQWDTIFPNERALILIEGIEQDGAWTIGHRH